MKSLFNWIVYKSIPVFMTLAIYYHLCINDPFFNGFCRERTRFEFIADTLLIPYQYALTGREVVFREDGSWYFEPRFDYTKSFWIKNIPAWLTAPLSFALGGGLKILVYIWDSEVKKRYEKLENPQPVHLVNEQYRQMGLFADQPISEEVFQPLNMGRRPGDEKSLIDEREALRELGSALTQAKILWWVDCGTCLGTYRYGGTIPWDLDVDIAILENDFQNAFTILSQVNPEKYVVADWSGRENPMTLIKILLRPELRKEIDVYCFRIHPQEKTLSFILSQENNVFSSEVWKERERLYKTPTSFDTVFPLKKATFDGVPVFVPNQVEKYLRRVYGENLSPAKIYNPMTDSYEKDFSHPYWTRPCAH